MRRGGASPVLVLKAFAAFPFGMPWNQFPPTYGDPTPLGLAYYLEDESATRTRLQLQAMTAARYDLVIIGTGMGGGVLAYALKDSGMKILLIERGDFLFLKNRKTGARKRSLITKRYKPNETWDDENRANHSHPGFTISLAATPRFMEQHFPGSEKRISPNSNTKRRNLARLAYHLRRARSILRESRTSARGSWLIR